MVEGNNSRVGRPEQVRIEQLRPVALRVADRDGAGNLSIRGVARELGVTPMALYRHVEDIQALQNLVVDEALRELAEPKSNLWRERVLEMMADTRSVLLRHPGAAGIVNMRAIPTPQVIALAERYIAALEEGGFQEEGVVEAFDAISAFVLGSVVYELTRQPSARLALTDGEGAASPRLARYRKHFAARHGERRFRRGAAALLSGLERDIRTE